MKFYRKLILGFALGAVVAVAGIVPASAKTLRLFVLTGQSNSLGTPTTNTEALMVLPKVGTYPADTNVPFFWDNTTDGTPAGNAALGNPNLVWTNICLQKGGYYTYSADHWGPEAGFARLLWDMGYRDFGIVKASRGGGGNSNWCKTNAPNNLMYYKVVNTVSNAVQTLPPGYTDFQVVCLLYLQGESDNTYEASIADSRFYMLLTNLQVDLPHASGMKAVLGEIGGDTDTANRIVVTQKQSALAAANPTTIGFAQSAGLKRQNVDGLNVHYNADSLIIMGERMAQEAVRLHALPETVLPAQTSLYAWYRGDHGVMPLSSDGVTLVASNIVTRWGNLTSGSTNGDLTQIVGQPLMTNGVFAGAAPQNFVRFDGASQAAWSTLPNFGPLTNARTLFFAVRVNGAGDGFLFDGSTSLGMTRAQVRANTWQAGIQPPPIANAASADPAVGPRDLGVWQFHEFSFTPTNGTTVVSHWVNGVNVATYTNANLNGLGGFILGANAQAQRFLGADIAEVMIYTNVLSPSDQTNVFNYLAANWTPTPPVAPPPAATNVYAWFTGDTSLNVGADNYSVTSWSNLGTAATNGSSTQASRNLGSLTGAPQKVYLRSPGGAAMGAVRFGGSDGVWTSKASFGVLTNNYTLVAYVRISNAVPQGFLFDSTSFTPGFTRALVWSNNWQASLDGSPGTITAPAATGVWQVQSFVVGTNSGAQAIQHYINGTLVGTVPGSIPDYLSGLMIGANVSQASGIQADVAEFMVFNTALDDATRNADEAYLSNKWAGVVADTNAPPPPGPYIYYPLFVSGTGYPEYRIPAMVTTTNGTVIAACDGRQSNADVPGFIDDVCRRSFDNGRTWQPLQVITDYGTSTNVNNVDTYPAYGITNPVTRRSASDPSLLLDRTNNRVWVLYDNGTTNGSGRAIKLEMKYSDDNGATWSPRVDVEAANPGLRPPRSSAPEFLCGPGNGIQMSEGTNAGRLIFPVYVFGNPYYSTLIYSDDHGATWQRGGNCGTGGGEIQIAETAGGGLLASMRDNNFPWNGVRTFSRSTDGGLTWGALFTNTTNPPTIPDPACQGSIIRFSTTNDAPGATSRLVFANCASSSGRKAMTLRVSYDEGNTWPVSNLVYSATSGYSALTRMANGEVGLLNEVNGYQRIDFVHETVGQISGGADTNLLNASPLLNLNVQPSGGGGQPALGFTALASNTYTIQYRDDLSTGAWQRLTDIAGLSSNALVQIPVANTNAQRFFRLVTPGLP